MLDLVSEVSSKTSGVIRNLSVFNNRFVRRTTSLLSEFEIFEVGIVEETFFLKGEVEQIFYLIDSIREGFSKVPNQILPDAKINHPI